MSDLADRLPRNALAAGAAGALALVLLLWLSGVGLLGAAHAVLAVLWIVGVPGLALTRGLGLGETSTSRLALAAVLGTVVLGPLFNLLTAIAAPALNPALLVLAWPAPFAVWLLLGRRGARRGGAFPLASLLGAALVLLVFLALLYLPAYQPGDDGGLTLCLAEPMLNGRPAAFHVALASQYGLHPELAYPFVAGHTQTLIHLHSHALTALLAQLPGSDPLVAEFRLMPLFVALLALLAVQYALGTLARPGSAVGRAALAALLGSPVLVLHTAVLPQTLLALAVLAAAVALAQQGVARGRAREVVVAGLLLGSLAQIDLHWAAVCLPGIGLAALWPGRETGAGHVGWRVRQHGLWLLAAAGLSALVATGLALWVSGIGAGPLQVLLAPGAFLALVAERAAMAFRASPALVLAGLLGLLVVYGAAAVYARSAWRELAPAPRRLLLGPLLFSVVALLLVGSRAVSSATVLFALPGLGCLALLTALGLRTPPPWLARLPGIVPAAALIAVGLLMALAAALTPCAERVVIDAEQAAALESVAAATAPGEPVAALDRSAAELTAWCGITRRPLAGVLGDALFVAKMDQYFRMPGIAEQAGQVQARLRTLAGAPDAAAAEAALSALDARVLELPADIALPAAVQRRLERVAATPDSVYYRRVEAGPGARE